MKSMEWTKATRKNGHAIPKLWIRKSGTYYAQLAILDPSTGKNVTRKQCLNTRNLKEAEDKLAELVTDRANGELKLRDDGPLVSEFLPHYLEVRKQERNIKTYQNEKCFLQQFAKFIGQKRLGEVSVRDIVDYRTKILKGGIVNHTANLHVTAIRNLYKQAMMEGEVEDSPAMKVSKLAHIAKSKSLLEDRQVTLLAKTAKTFLPRAGQQVSDWILSMAYSGGRMSEVLSLKWSDIDFIEKKLTFRRETVKFKRAARSVEFNPKLEAHLKEMHVRRDQKSEWLFPSTREAGNRVKEYGHDLAKVSAEAGLPDVTSHYFRHYFISTCARLGVASKVVIDWVGHKDFKMVMEVYTHFSGDFRKSEAEKMTFETKTTKPKANRFADKFFS